MAGEVNVGISSLERLSYSLAETLPMLDRLRDENTAMIMRAKEKIDLVLNEYIYRKNTAYDRYQQALSDLRNATYSYQYVPDSYYQNVNECEAEYNRLQQCLNRINEIKTECEAETSQCEKVITENSESFTLLLKKSDSFLSRFIELLNKSRTSLGNDGYSKSSALSSSKSGGKGQSLATTNQTWRTNSDGTLTFDSPDETGELLDSNQGKVAGFRGTCGLVSCANVLRLSGIDATEEQIVSYASGNGLCANGNTNPDNNGATNPSERQALLEHFGIHSELRPGDVDNIAAAVSEGRGVIASFDAGKLWDNPDYYGSGHAVTITSVKKDASGNILGFYVCDSGTGGKDKSAFFSASQISSALRPGRQINVTSVIR